MTAEQVLQFFDDHLRPKGKRAAAKIARSTAKRAVKKGE